MRNMFFIFLMIQSVVVFGQRSDGFFIQDLSFIDPVLLAAYKVDKVVIEVYENSRKNGTLVIFLDSNQRLMKRVTKYQDSITTFFFESTIISQYACPIVKPSYIKQCEAQRIIKTENNGAYRFTDFDEEGRVIRDFWKPVSKALEIRRQFVYSKRELLDTVKLEDLKSDGSIPKRELHVYNYNNDEQLMFITQLISFGNGYRKAGLFKFKNYNSGLVKQMEGTGYDGRWKSKVHFKYYSKGKALR